MNKMGNNVEDDHTGLKRGKEDVFPKRKDMPNLEHVWLDVLETPKVIKQAFTVDIQVDNGANNDATTHSYQIVIQDKDEQNYALMSHNTVSLLAGATPGVHFPISKYYIRRVRIANNSALIKPLKEAGYNIEPVSTDDYSVVVDFPIKLEENIKTQNDVSMWEKLELAALLQQYWADNQVSVTVDFDEKTEGNQIKSALDYFQYRTKSLSFLPRTAGYKHAPYEAITEEEYNGLVSKLKPLNFDDRDIDGVKELVEENFCDGDSCVL